MRKYFNSDKEELDTMVRLSFDEYYDNYCCWAMVMAQLRNILERAYEIWRESVLSTNTNNETTT